MAILRRGGVRRSHIQAKNAKAMDRLSPALLRTFWGVCEAMDDKDTPITLRGLVDRLGIQRNAVFQQLRVLRQLGLVQMLDGKAGTIRPLYRIEIRRG